ncbi:hypothetical protein R3P38DRAFT_2889249 [Favolaschia claudopus]|uniref:Mediator of RNA polymerase II transcription subunit 25 von Willebrand factor type A domain-containing protein n=1 Tax=Favolaschia claudopus TaxID=2862362 RepID=A0AAW0CTY0_9AGAR
MASEAMIAIAFVVDSSTTLASEWTSILQGYIMPMLRRLGESNPPGIKFRVAFVTYGTQSMPILSKNFFDDLNPLLSAFRDDPSKLGLGQTSCGGSMGMAALEGFVAALELFDILKQSKQVKNLTSPPVSHIFHVAAGAPDSAERPQCNQFPILDCVTWDSLPSEMKKRNIHLSSISVKSKVPKFTDLHSTSSLVAPWFAVRPQHTVLLAGYATPPQKGLKRPGDPMPVTPDPKRAKITTPSNSSPHNNPTASPAPPTQTPVPPPMQIPPPTALPPPTAMQGPATAGPSAPNAPPTNLATIQQRFQVLQNAFRMTEQLVRDLTSQLTDARNKGDMQTVERLLPQWRDKNALLTKIKASIQPMLTQLAQQRAAFVHAQQAMAAQQAAQANAQGMHPGPGLGPTPPVPPPAAAPGQPGGQLPPSELMKQDSPDLQMIAPPDNSNDTKMSPPPPLPSSTSTLEQQHSTAPGHMRSASGGGGVGGAGHMRMPSMGNSVNPGAMTASPVINQQMAKMLEQKERARQSSGAGPIPPPNMPQPQQHSPVWQGRLNWSGTNPAGGARDVTTYVVASSANRDACHAETWPLILNLTLTDKHAVSIESLQLWMKRVEPAICTFRCNPTHPNVPNNEMSYKALVAMLITKNFYFVASWTLPNGKVSANVLIFPVRSAGLIGAFFPLTGIPELPQDLGGNVSNPSIIPNPNPMHPAAALPASGPSSHAPSVPPQGAAATAAANSASQLMANIDAFMRQNQFPLPPPMIAQLAKMNPLERNKAMAMLLRSQQEKARQRLQQQQQQQQQNGGPGGAAGGGMMGMPPMGMGLGLGGPQMGGQMQQQQSQPPQQPDMSGGFNPAQFGLGLGGMDGGGGGMAGGMSMGAGTQGMFNELIAGQMPRNTSNPGGGAVSYQMMQSFMHRNSENAGS